MLKTSFGKQEVLRCKYVYKYRTLLHITDILNCFFLILDPYAFIEASEPRFIGDTAIMTSGVMLGAMCMRFRYHMYGEEIGTLSVFRNGDGVMQQLLWQQDGNQGDFWHEAEFIIDCNVTKYQVCVS